MEESHKYPVDEWGFPEQGEHESFMHYHERWLQLYATENAKRKSSTVTQKAVRVLADVKRSYIRRTGEKARNQQSQG